MQSQSGERSFAVTTEQVENLPINHGNFTSVTSLVPGVVQNGASAGGTRLGGGGQNNIMMDGVSTMDTGNNGQMLQMNVESIAEVKVLTQGYQAEYGRSSGLQITAVTKSGTNRFRGVGLRRATQLGLEREQLGQHAERRPQGQDQDQDSRATPSAARSGSRAATTSCSSSTAQEYAPTTTAINGGNPIRFRVPTALERAGDFSQTLDNNGALFNLIQGSDLDGCRARRRTPPAASRTAASSAGFRRTVSIRPGVNILNRYPLPNMTQGAGQNYNYEVRAAVDRQPDAAAGHPPRLPDVAEAALHGQVLRPARAQAGRRPGTISGFNDVLNPYPFITNYGATVNYTLNADDVHRRHLRLHPQPARRAARSIGGILDEPTRRTGSIGRWLPTSRCSIPTPASSIRATTRYDV